MPSQVRREGRLPYRGRRTRAAVGVLDICAGAPGQLLEQEGPFYPQLVDLTFDARQAEAGGVVGIFHLVGAVLELDALAAIRLLDRGRQRGRRGWLRISMVQLSLLRRHGGWKGVSAGGRAQEAEEEESRWASQNGLRRMGFTEER